DNLVTRDNPSAININRDHVTLATSEARVIQSVVRDYQPHVIVDVHEGNNITHQYATSPALTDAIDAELRGMSATLDTVVKDAIEGAGYTWERYQPGAEVQGPEYFHNAAGLHNAVGLLLESERKYGDDSDAAERHTLQRIAL